MYHTTRLLTLLFSALLFHGFSYADETSVTEEPKVFKLGIIGTTTSHVNAFITLLNDPNREGIFKEFEIVGAYGGGMPDNPSSWDRVEPIKKFVVEKGIPVYPTIEEMLPNVDGVLLESVDGRPHLEQAKPVIASGKPIFIDKPMASTLADAIRIFELAKEKNVPVFSSSSLRFSAGAQAIWEKNETEPCLGAFAWSPSSRNPLNPGLFWYGIHGVESLFTLMGTGCEQVSCVGSDRYDLATGVWKDGRVGSFRGDRDGKGGYGATVFTAKGVVDGGKYDGYKPLVEQFCLFFKNGVSPVSAGETLEIMAFMEAAEESLAAGGKIVRIDEVMKRARSEKEAFVKIRLVANGTVTLEGKETPLENLAASIDSFAAADTVVKVILSAEQGYDPAKLAEVCNNLGKATLAQFLY